MFKNSVTASESTLPKQSVPLADRIANSEAMLLGFLAEKSLPFSLAPDLLDLVKELSKDRKALNGIKMHRTAASYKLRLGVAKTFEENLLEDLKKEKFSLNIDESTSNNNEKVVTVLVNYLRKDRIVTEHLQSFSVNSVNSAVLFDSIVKLIDDKSIPWNNMMSVLLDSCNVMRGKKSGLESKLREKCPNLLDIDGDSCHHAHNCAKQFCKQFGLHIESLITDIHNDLKWSPDLRAALMEICDILQIKYTMPQNYVSFRWLSVYDAAQDFLRMLSALTLFYFSFLSRSQKTEYLYMVIGIYKRHNVSETAREYIRKIYSNLEGKNMTEAGKERKSRITRKLFDCNFTTKLIANLFVSVLPMLQEYIKLFQSSIPMIHKLHDKQFELIKSFFACFLKPEVFASLGNSEIVKIDVKQKCHHLPVKSIFVGQKAKELIASAPKGQYENIRSFRENTLKAYIACAQALQHKMPIANAFLSSVSSIDPLCRKHSLALKHMKKLPEMVKNILLPQEKELYELEVQKYHVDNFNSLNENDPIDKWWIGVRETGKYPFLSKMALSLLTCFHGPKVESSFSMMNSIITTSSTRMNIPTFSAIQTVKYHLLAENKSAVKYFVKKDFLHECIDRNLVNNIRSSCRNYEDEKKSKRELKQKQIDEKKLNKEKLLSKEAAKKLCANAAKNQRLKHKKKMLKVKSYISNNTSHSNPIPAAVSSLEKASSKITQVSIKERNNTKNEKLSASENASCATEKSKGESSKLKRVYIDKPSNGPQKKKLKKAPLTITEIFKKISAEKKN